MCTGCASCDPGLCLRHPPYSFLINWPKLTALVFTPSFHVGATQAAGWLHLHGGAWIKGDPAAAVPGKQQEVPHVRFALMVPAAVGQAGGNAATAAGSNLLLQITAAGEL